MHKPLSFMPDRTDFDQISIEAYNSLMEEFEALKKALDETENELVRARQKIAHLLKDRENK